MVVGADRKFVGALIVPSFATLKTWMEEQGMTYTTNAEAVAHPKVIELFTSIIAEYNTLFNHVEQVKKFALLDKEWTVESGEMTPKLSLKRKVVMENYKAAIESIYAE
jgi:long-chain acyl-CoA synthetase